MTHPVPESPQPASAPLELVSSTPARPTAAYCAGIAPELAAGLSRLLQQSGSDLRLEPGSTPLGGGRGFLLRPPEGSWLRELAEAGMEVHPVQGLRGLVRGPSPTLEAIIIGLPAGAESRLIAGAAGLMGRALAEDAAVLCVGQPGAAAALSQALPRATVTDSGATEAMELLLRPPHAVSVIVTTVELAGLFSAAARAVCGAGDLALTIRARKGVVACEPVAAPGAPADGAGLALAAAWTLFCAGHYRVAARACNALFKTLEDGLHTGGIRLALPYSRELNDLEFLQAVEARLGESPQRIAAVAFEARQTRHLQRVV